MSLREKSEAEIYCEIKEAFQIFDRDNDGIITKEEEQTILRMFGINPMKKRIKIIKKKIKNKKMEINKKMKKMEKKEKMQKMSLGIMEKKKKVKNQKLKLLNLMNFLIIFKEN